MYGGEFPSCSFMRNVYAKTSKSCLVQAFHVSCSPLIGGAQGNSCEQMKQRKDVLITLNYGHKAVLRRAFTDFDIAGPI